mmetsp:Transcript_2125/g.5629  ORF Transcript_2125/g.5629 Transcript_2125/m.5629 type:complete len:213 (-) Transcript_2125:217-855(-)
MNTERWYSFPSSPKFEQKPHNIVTEKQNRAMVMSTTRACSACHAAKVKCVKIEGDAVCKRCQRLGLKCVEHVSRQGQGTRRRKKVKAKLPKDEQSAMDGPVKITADLAKKSLCNSSMDLFNGASPIPCTSAAIVSCSPCTVSCNDQFNNNINNNNDKHSWRTKRGCKHKPRRKNHARRWCIVRAGSVGGRQTRTRARRRRVLLGGRARRQRR